MHLKRTGDLADEDVELSNRHSESSPGRYKWTPVQVLEIKSAFASNIKHESITMEQVRDTVNHITAAARYTGKESTGQSTIVFWQRYFGS